MKLHVKIDLRRMRVLGLAAMMVGGAAFTSAIQPAQADRKDAREEREEAREDIRDAHKAEHNARVSRAKGNGFMARLHARHARHQRERAAKHYGEARREMHDD